jgi:dihydrofolate synthase / folylpolyglutamate synthase
VAIGTQPPEVLGVFLEHAARLGAPVHLRGRDWHVTPSPLGFRYQDGDGMLDLPPPSLPGAFQLDNAGIAIAAIRASGLALRNMAIGGGIAAAEWPARLQRLRGRLAGLLPGNWELWLDGGHNPGAGAVLAEHLRSWRDRPVHLIVGMKRSKDSEEFLRPLLPLASTLWAVAEEHQHDARPVEEIVAASGGKARPGPYVADALRAVGREPGPARVLICGSLYLAGEVLQQDANERAPDA